MRERKEQKQERVRVQTMTDLWDHLGQKYGSEATNWTVPQDIDAERSLLATLMIDSTAMGRVIGLIGTPTFIDLPFVSEQHRWIWTACVSLYQDSAPIDWLTVTNRLKRMDQAGFVGAPGKLVEMTEAFVTSANIESHAYIVQEKHTMRMFLLSMQEYSARTMLDQEDVFEAMRQFSERLGTMLAQNDKKSKLERADKFTVEAMEKIEQGSGGLTGVSTGLSDLDELTCGWQPSDLILLGGRPSMGKTALSLTFVKGAIFPPARPLSLKETTEQREKQAKLDTAWVAYFSLEMPSVMIILRMLCNLAKVDMQKVRKRELTDNDWKHLASAMNMLRNKPWYIDDTGAQTVQDIRQKAIAIARRMRQEGYVKGEIIIDYVGLLSTSERVFDRNDEVSKYSKALKNLAKELVLPVIALSQLNRKVDERRDGRPQNSDLRDSGGLEQDADVIAFIYRPERYNIETDKDGNSTKGMAEVIVSKQRNGPIDDVKIEFIASQQRFEDRRETLYDNMAAAPADAPYKGVDFSKHTAATSGPAF